MAVSATIAFFYNEGQCSEMASFKNCLRSKSSMYIVIILKVVDSPPPSFYDTYYYLQHLQC